MGASMSLVLTRNLGQRIFINGEEIKISVYDVKGEQVKLAIEAPKNILILRKELEGSFNAFKS
jgi:carbon storage regulator